MIKCWGTRYRFHPLFVLVMASSVITGYFLELVTLFSIVFIHELGHVAAAKGFGWNVLEVQLLPFGGVAVVEHQGNVRAGEEIAVSLAGPLQNGLMIALASLMETYGWWSTDWGAYFIQANIMIGLFNLIPILPLDGGRVLQAFMSMYISYHRTIVYCSLISLFLSMSMLIIALFQYSTLGVQLNILVIALFLIYSNWYTYRHIPFHFIRFLVNRELKVNSMITRGALAQPIVVSEHRSIAQIVRLFMRERVHLIYVLNEKGVVQAVLPEQKLLQTYFIENKPESAVSDIFR